LIQKNLRVLFRISGGRAVKKQLGLGHVNRCVNLANSLQHCKKIFLIEDYGGVEDFLRRKKIKNIHRVTKGLDVQSDIKETSAQIIKNQIDILIVDKNEIKISFIKQLRKITKVIVITDLNKIEFPANLVINGFVGLENKITVNKYGTKCLLGPKFQILNEIYRRKNKDKSNKKKYKLLITFGGFDENNIFEVFLDRLQKFPKKMKTRAILGPFTKKSKKIKKFEKEYRNNLSIIERTTNMKKEISKAEFGFCSGGITTYEFSRMGIPFAVISQVKHQLKTAERWEQKGMAINLGLINKKIGKKIDKTLLMISQNKIPIITNSQFVDGLASKRIAKHVLRLK